MAASSELELWVKPLITASSIAKLLLEYSESETQQSALIKKCFGSDSELNVASVRSNKAALLELFHTCLGIMIEQRSYQPPSSLVLTRKLWTPVVDNMYENGPFAADAEFGSTVDLSVIGDAFLQSCEAVWTSDKLAKLPGIRESEPMKDVHAAHPSLFELDRQGKVSGYESGHRPSDTMVMRSESDLSSQARGAVSSSHRSHGGSRGSDLSDDEKEPMECSTAGGVRTKTDHVLFKEWQPWPVQSEIELQNSLAAKRIEECLLQLKKPKKTLWTSKQLAQLWIDGLNLQSIDAMAACYNDNVRSHHLLSEVMVDSKTGVLQMLDNWFEAPFDLRFIEYEFIPGKSDNCFTITWTALVKASDSSSSSIMKSSSSPVSVELMSSGSGDGGKSTSSSQSIPVRRVEGCGVFQIDDESGLIISEKIFWDQSIDIFANMGLVKLSSERPTPLNSNSLMMMTVPTLSPAHHQTLSVISQSSVTSSPAASNGHSAALTTLFHPRVVSSINLEFNIDHIDASFAAGSGSISKSAALNMGSDPSSAVSNASDANGGSINGVKPLSGPSGWMTVIFGGTQELSFSQNPELYLSELEYRRCSMSRWRTVFWITMGAVFVYAIPRYLWKKNRV